MKLTFVLPGAAPTATGGVRMVLRYANALVEGGWDVTVIFPSRLEERFSWQSLARGIRFEIWRATRQWSPRRWTAVDERVKLQWVPSLSPEIAPDGDFVVATAVRTAEAVAHWPARSGAKFYFVQGYETWDLPAERVNASWRLPLVKIAVSRWLCDLIAAAGQFAHHLPNGLDHITFGLDRSLDTPREPVLSWPHHPLPWKGSGDVQAILADLAAVVPGLRFQSFGTGSAPPPTRVPVAYFRNPPPALLRRIYNETAVFVAPSHSEGWGLPASEALQCGCALAATDVGGHREFLRHGENALLHRPGDRAALMANVRRLLADTDLRRRLAVRGRDDLAAFRFDAAVERLKSILREGARS